MAEQFLFYGNGPYANRGCEAIVRGTAEILRRAFGTHIGFLNAYFPWGDDGMAEADPAIGLNPLPHDVATVARTSLVHRCLDRLPYRLRTRPALRSLYLRRLGPALLDGLGPRLAGFSAALALGGDNYTLDYGFPARLLALDSAIVQRGVPVIYWGATIGPFDAKSEPFVMPWLRRHGTAFFVRENRTREYLRANGIRENVVVSPDPAFVMAPSLPSGLGFALPASPIGINLSPLLAKYVCGGDAERWLAMGEELLRRILGEFDHPIVLVPHVTIARSDDHRFLNSLRKKLGSPARLMIAPRNLSAAQTKWLISQCCCLIAARTHATIAAFSTAVPTVSLAYSEKALGINEYLFGHRDYVVPREQINASQVVATARRVLREAEGIRQELAVQRDRIRESAFAAGEQLRDILCRT